MRSALGLLVCALAAAVLAAPAGAHSAVPWFGTYDVSVAGGSQDVTWTYDHSPVSRCDAQANGSGTDNSSFLPGASATVQLGGVGTSLISAELPPLQVNYSEDRDGSITSGTPEGGEGCTMASGEGAASLPTPDCGTRSLSIEATIVPGPGAASVEGIGAPGAETPYKDCPAFGDVLPHFAAPVAAALPPLGPAIDGGVPTGVARLTATEPITDEPDASGTSTLDLELRFTRVFVLDALGAPADASLTVSAAGDVTAPVSCPAGPACSGTVSLDIVPEPTSETILHVGSQTGSSAGAARYPAPVPKYSIPVASARFRLRGGHRGATLHLRGGRRFASSLSSAPLAIVISAGAGSRSARYVAGLARLRP